MSKELYKLLDKKGSRIRTMNLLERFNVKTVLDFKKGIIWFRIKLYSRPFTKRSFWI